MKVAMTNALAYSGAILINTVKVLWHMPKVGQIL
jgi:hypothetical protein